MSQAALVAEHLEARRTGTHRWIARCPAHEDRAPSLTIAEGRDGRVLLHCFAGCDLAMIVRSAGLTMPQLFAASRSRSPRELALSRASRDRQRAADAALRRAERVRIDKLRLQWQQRNRQLSALARSLSMMPDGAAGSEDLTVCLHNLIAELRSIDSALNGEID